MLLSPGQLVERHMRFFLFSGGIDDLDSRTLRRLSHDTTTLCGPRSIGDVPTVRHREHGGPDAVGAVAVNRAVA